MKWLSFLACAFVFVCSNNLASAGLKEYVNQPDPTYQYSIASTMKSGPVEASLIQMTSQTWQGIVWTHWLAVFRPAEVSHPEHALLLISGGNNNSAPPKLDSEEGRVLADLAVKTKSMTAVLMQVPNQPLFGGMREDQIIAYTYDKFLNGESDDWPLLLPMVKSAVRAMDAIQSVAREQYQQDIEKFVLTGASKRGWTTWLSAASDPRVEAIAPMVIDMLNLPEQSPHQLASYGAFSNQVKDYTERNIQERFDSEKGRELLALVDPYTYRNDLKMPKYIILGANDPYWTVDSANYYFPGLKGKKYLCYQANTGHDLNGFGRAGLSEFYAHTIAGMPLPGIKWKSRKGELEVTWKADGGQATLWQAHSSNRDFRESAWESTPLEGGHAVTARVEAPAQGRIAYYVEVSFPGMLGERFGMTTQMTVVPDTYPEFSAKHEKSAAQTP